MKKEHHFLAIYSEGFPYKISASNNKNLLIAKSLMPYNFEPFVFSKQYYSQLNDPEASISGQYEGVNFKYLNKSTTNSVSSIIFAFLKEGYFLYKKSRGFKKKVFIVKYTNFLIFIYYFLLSKLLGLKLILSIAEWHIEVGINKKGLNKWNAFIFDKYAPRLASGIIPISKFIFNEMLKSNKEKDIFLLPILTDFQYINSVNSSLEKNSYFLFCGAIGYLELIEFVLESYSLFLKKDVPISIKLKLVLHGPKKDINQLINQIFRNDLLKNKVSIEVDLDYADLIKRYKSAIALLIPLRNTIQDKARFPHKVAEYLASGRPIITNNWGEVGYYLSDKVNALIAENYNFEEYAELMKYAFKNKEMSDRIGQNGKDLCMNNFDYSKYGKDLASFLLK